MDSAVATYTKDVKIGLYEAGLSPKEVNEITDAFVNALIEGVKQALEPFKEVLEPIADGLARHIDHDDELVAALANLKNYLDSMK